MLIIYNKNNNNSNRNGIYLLITSWIIIIYLIIIINNNKSQETIKKIGLKKYNNKCLLLKFNSNYLSITVLDKTHPKNMEIIIIR